MKNPLLRFSLFVFCLVAVFSVSGCNSVTKRDYKTVVARFYVESSGNDAYASAMLPVSGVRIGINGKAVITELDIVHVEESVSDMGHYLVFQLTPAAGRDLYRLTGTHQGSRLVLAINDVPLGARLIDTPFSGGYIAIFVELPDADLPELVKNLNGTSAEIQKKIAKG